MPEPSQSSQKRCFVIGPIGDKDSGTRKRSDTVLEHVFKKALSSEYLVKRADEISEPGMITSQILQAIQDWDLVLADLTEHNPNVFYELAVRHAIERPIIHVIDTHWRIPFDVAGFRTIPFDFTDLNSVAEAIKQIREQATEVSKGNWGGTPIKIANLMRPTHGDSPQTLLLQETLEGISELRADIKYDLINAVVTLKEEIKALELRGRQGPYLSNLNALLGYQSATGVYGIDGKPIYIPALGSPSGSIEIDKPVIPITSSPQSIPSVQDAAKSNAGETTGKK